MASFESTGTALVVRFEPEEVNVLSGLLDQLERLLTDAPMEDPIRSRLFPKAHQDQEDQLAYEELVGQQLLSEKLRVVQETRATLGANPLELNEASLHPWLVVLTDLRLTIGTRLGVTEEVMARELDPEDPDAPALSVLHWLGWVQESLLSLTT